VLVVIKTSAPLQFVETVLLEPCLTRPKQGLPKPKGTEYAGSKKKQKKVASFGQPTSLIARYKSGVFLCTQLVTVTY